MAHHDLTKIKHFIRVSFEIEASLNVSHLQKKILLKVLELWGHQSTPARIGQLTVSVPGISERSIYRHLKLLIQEGWLKISTDKQDRRIKIIIPSRRLLQVLSAKLSNF